MVKLREKKAKLGRNDPCRCGSGKKYKDCHLPVEQAYRAEQLRLRQAQDTLLPKIIEAAQGMPAAIPAAFELFWQGKYTPEQMNELDDLEDRGAERFLTWFAFDYQQDNGQTLVEHLNQTAGQGDLDVDEFEARLLQQWTAVRLRPYIVAEVHKGQGIKLRDLLDESGYYVSDSRAAKRLQVSEVVVGHIIPVDKPPDAGAPTYYLAGAAAQLTGDTAEKLVEFARLYLEDLRRAQPDATWGDLLRQRSYALNHFVMALPHEQPDVGVLDNIITEARVQLKLTSESLAGLAGRGKEEDERREASAEKKSRSD